MFLQNFLQFLNSSPLNWIDFFIIIVIFFYAIEGYSQGFYLALLDLISFVAAFILGLSFYYHLSNILIKTLSIPQGFAKALGFFTIAFLTEIIISLLLRTFVKKTIFFKNLSKSSVHKILNSVLGIFPGIFSAIVLIAFILTMIMTLPVSAYLKKAVSKSIIGSKLVTNTQGLGKDINNIFGGAVNEGLAFFTVEPRGNESVNLNFETKEISIDQTAEREMFIMVNNERQKQEISKLQVDTALTKVAREHCEDMFKRGYFSHNTPEGYTPFDRMTEADISFVAAGENLALAPNADLAMDGFMKSEGHRENILSSEFGKIGVGVIDGGIYGEMFCQEFTD